MRSFVLGAIVAAGLSLVSAVPTSTGQRRRHWSSGGGYRYRQPGALLVHMAGMARLLPALALLVMPP